MDFQQVVSLDNMRKSDAHTISEHIASYELMYKAANGIFKAVSFCGRVAIVCGKGNNAGDGYALACILCKNGITPTIVRVSDSFSKDGLYYYKAAKSLGVEELSLDEIGNFTGYDIVVDCLLGTGFSGEIANEFKNAIEQINLTNAYVISADINSGINGDTGVGAIAVNSDLTVSIGNFKTGMFLNDAPYYIDLLTNVDIGVHLLKEEYKLIDYSNLYMFEGYGAEVYSTEEFYSKYNLDINSCNITSFIAKLSADTRKTIVVKTEHSAIIADLKYVYFCADYIKS